MNQIKNVSAFAFIIFSSAIASAQCKDGICRIPSANSPAGYSNTSFRDSSSFTSYGNEYSPEVCADGRCHLGSYSDGQCNGPNCPSHLQNGDRRPSDNLTGRSGNYDRQKSLADYEAGRLQAPRPVSQQYQAVGYTPQISWTSDYAQGLEQSRRTGRPMLVKVSAEWCSYCQRMKRDTFSDQGIVRDISSAFVPVALDADHNRRLIQQMGVRTLPAIVIITPDLRIVDRIEGYKTARQLNASLLRHTQRAELTTDIKVATR